MTGMGVALAVLIVSRRAEGLGNWLGSGGCGLLVFLLVCLIPLAVSFPLWYYKYTVQVEYHFKYHLIKHHTKYAAEEKLSPSL